MKTAIFILAIIASNLWAQIPDTLWITSYSGEDSIDNEPVKLLVDQSGNIIVTGIQYTNTGQRDIVTIKYNADGIILWSDVYDGPAHKSDEPTHLTIDAYGYIYVYGESTGRTALSDCRGIVIMKYHPTGEPAWFKRFDEQTGTFVYAQGITVDPERNIICTSKLVEGQTLTMNELITRKFYPTGDQIWEVHLPVHKWSWCYGINSDALGDIYLGGWLWQGIGNPDYEFFALLKYAANGELQWFSAFRDSTASDAWSEVFTQDKEGNFIAAGETEKITGEDVFATVKFDENGNFIWYKEFPAGIYPEVYDITVDDNGNVIWLAEAENDSSYEYETIIAKYFANGDSAWVNSFPDDYREPIALITDDEGSIYILRNIKIDLGVEGLLLQKFDSEGKTIWNVVFTDISEPAEIAVDKDKNIIVCAYYYYENKGYIKTIKLTQSDVSSADINSEYLTAAAFTLDQNYPNPFNPTTKITYQIPLLSFVTLKVYDVLGNEIERLVNEEMSAGNYELEFNAANLPSGVYFYQLRAGNFIQTRKMILLK